MVRVFGVVQDLIDIVHVRSLNKDDMGPPFPEMGGDLDHLVLRF